MLGWIHLFHVELSFVNCVDKIPQNEENLALTHREACTSHQLINILRFCLSVHLSVRPTFCSLALGVWVRIVRALLSTISKVRGQ